MSRRRWPRQLPKISLRGCLELGKEVSLELKVVNFVKGATTMSLKAAFIFVAPGADSLKHHAVVDTPAVSLRVIGVKNYQEAEEVTKQLVDEGCAAIELCAGFGAEGAARVKKAAAGKAAVGVVRFDNHPGLGFKSGDEIFR